MVAFLPILSLFHSLCCTSAGSNDINEILDLLGPTCYMFHELGRGLNLEASVMGVILYEARRSSPYDSLTEVLSKWMTMNYSYQTLGEPSLSMLVKAVDTYDHSLAVKVFQKFTSTTGELRFTCTC